MYTLVRYYQLRNAFPSDRITSLNTFITPISAILLGVLVLHEGFVPIQIAGIVVVFIGLVVIDGRLFKRRAPAPA